MPLYSGFVPLTRLRHKSSLYPSGISPRDSRCKHGHSHFHPIQITFPSLLDAGRSHQERVDWERQRVPVNPRISQIDPAGKENSCQSAWKSLIQGQCLSLYWIYMEDVAYPTQFSLLLRKINKCGSHGRLMTWKMPQ